MNVSTVIAKPAFTERSVQNSSIPLVFGEEENQEEKIESSISQFPINSKIESKEPSKFTLAISSLIDALFRGLFRFPEKEYINSKVRPFYRFLTEVIRKGSEGSVIQLLENKSVTKDVWKTGAKRALENALATVVIEPNMADSRISRVAFGCGNMIARFVARLGMFGLNIIDKKELKVEGLPEEFFARSLCRLAYFSSGTQLAGIGVRTMEQFLINLCLHIGKPAAKLFNFLSKSSPTIG